MPTPGKHSFHLKGTEQDVLNKVLSAYGLTVMMDSSVGTQTIRFDADDVDYEHAAALVSMATGSFIVPLDPKRVLVARDTKENRTQYDRMALETLRLPGLTPAEMSDMGNIARTVVGVEQATVQQEFRNSDRASAPRHAGCPQRNLGGPARWPERSLLDVRVIEVGRTRMMNIGVQMPQTATLFNLPSELNTVLNGNQSLVQQIISSGLASAGDTAAIAAILIASGQVSSSILTQPFATFGGGLTESGLSVGGPTGESIVEFDGHALPRPGPTEARGQGTGADSRRNALSHRDVKLLQHWSLFGKHSGADQRGALKHFGRPGNQFE